jgi:hypothetical protein
MLGLAILSAPPLKSPKSPKYNFPPFGHNPFCWCLLVKRFSWGCFRAPFGALRDGLASRSRGSDDLPGHNWLRDHLGERCPVKRGGNIPESYPDGSMDSRSLKRVLARAPETVRILAPERTCRCSLARRSRSSAPRGQGRVAFSSFRSETRNDWLDSHCRDYLVRDSPAKLANGNVQSI